MKLDEEKVYKFLQKIDKESLFYADRCWVWQGSIRGNGYGQCGDSRDSK